MKRKLKKVKNSLTALIILFILISCAILFRFYSVGEFDSVETLQEFMKSFGIFAPLALTVLQALQVIIPVLPGFFGCAVGAVLFGTMGGFWCNYIGISVGSIISYYLARKFGIDIVLLMFSKEKYEKWSAKIVGSKYYGLFLFVATLLPLFPDDFLCYFSGLIKMDAKKFTWIIILGKPWCILVYSIIFGMFGGNIS